MSYARTITIILLSAAATLAQAQVQVQAQAPAVPQYGANVSNEQARRALGAAVADARRLNLSMAVAVVDTAGLLVAFERLDNTQNASIAIALDKAISAAMYRRPTKVFQDALAAGGTGLRILTLRVTAIEGGIPLVVDGRIIGAVGVSGGTAEQDGEVARAGVAAVAR